MMRALTLQELYESVVGDMSYHVAADDEEHADSAGSMRYEALQALDEDLKAMHALVRELLDRE